MKPGVEKKHVFGEKTPRLIRTKRIIGGVAAVSESRNYIDYKLKELRSENRTTASLSSNLIRELSKEYEPGFIAKTRINGTEIELESANHSAKMDYQRDDPQFNQWRLKISTHPDKGTGHTTIIEGDPFWRSWEDYAHSVSGVRLITVHPETGKKYDYSSEEEGRLQRTTNHAFRLLHQARKDGVLEVTALGGTEATSQEEAA